jgi:hypothetical protein
VSAFDADRRTCAARLEAHNARRREAKARRRAASRRAAAPRMPTHTAAANGSPLTGGDGDASAEPRDSRPGGGRGGSEDDANSAWRDTSRVATDMAQLERALFDDSLLGQGDFFRGEELCSGGGGGGNDVVTGGAAALVEPSSASSLWSSLSSLLSAGAEGAAKRYTMDPWMVASMDGGGMASFAAACAATAAARRELHAQHEQHEQAAQPHAGEAIVRSLVVAPLGTGNAHDGPSTLSPAAAFQAGYYALAAATTTGMHEHHVHGHAAAAHSKLLQHAAAAQVPLHLPAFPQVPAAAP